MEKRLILYIVRLVLLLILLTAVGCNRRSVVDEKMDLADSLMTSKPDSALAVLESIPASDVNGKETSARYALLKSMALDKNYIDTITFDVLQPAIEYYPKHGTPDEQLRTYYYQGRIYHNRSDYDMAMQTFLKANDLKDAVSDTLTLANLLVAQGVIYYKSYQISDFVENNLRASDLYARIDKKHYELSCLLKALDGCIINNDRQKADSVVAIARPLSESTVGYEDLMSQLELTYRLNFGSKQEIKDILSEITDLSEISDEFKMGLCYACIKQGNIKMAKTIFDAIDGKDSVWNSPKYLLVKTDVLEAMGDYHSALDTYKIYFAVSEKENARIYSQKTAVAQELHDMRMTNVYDIQKRDRLIWICLCCVLMLIVIVGFIYYHLRNAKLECERQKLVSENLQHRIVQLEEESGNLKELLDRGELSNPVTDVIKERIDILNGLLAAQITDNESYSKPYKDWINKVTEDRIAFMNSTRLAFTASYPNFIKYLENQGVTTDEINYLCLYAIGLRGKEVGEYIQLRRHYHISSDVRKKLGLSEHETNLGIYIRKLMKNL